MSKLEIRQLAASKKRLLKQITKIDTRIGQLTARLMSAAGKTTRKGAR